MLATKSNDLDEDEAFLRRLILPEEDRRLFTSAPWRGGYRWFRSHNVIPIEQWRGHDTPPRPAECRGFNE